MKTLLIYKQLRSFVKDDIENLNSFASADSYQLKTEKPWFSFFFHQLKFILFSLLKGWKFDVFYIWFCDYHAFTAVFIAKLLGKKSIIVVGGFDAVKIPSIQYGLFNKNNLRAKLAKWAYENCDLIIPVDESLIQSNNEFAGKESVTGVLNFVPEAKDKIITIPTGFNANDWVCKSKKKRQVITVASVNSKTVLHRKGVYSFLQVAKNLPTIPFILIGLKSEEILPNELRNLPNVITFSEMPREDLLAQYCESKVYMQLSISEGLPTSLCEAMLCECIPVGSTANGIPYAVGNTGFLLNEHNIELATELVKQALESDDSLGKQARKRIQKLFTKEKRRKLLKQEMQQLLN